MFAVFDTIHIGQGIYLETFYAKDAGSWAMTGKTWVGPVKTSGVTTYTISKPFLNYCRLSKTFKNLRNDCSNNLDLSDHMLFLRENMMIAVSEK